MRSSVRIEGLRETDQALGQLRKSTAKALLRRVLEKRAQPIADDMERRAAKRTGALKDGVGVGVRLSRRQAQQRRRESTVEVFAGAGVEPQAIQEEFGNADQAPRPFARPAWEHGKGPALEGIKQDLDAEISATAARAERRAANRARRIARG